MHQCARTLGGHLFDIQHSGVGEMAISVPALSAMCPLPNKCA
jgi:hypothetical protein